MFKLFSYLNRLVLLPAPAQGIKSLQKQSSTHFQEEPFLKIAYPFYILSSSEMFSTYRDLSLSSVKYKLWITTFNSKTVFAPNYFCLCSIRGKFLVLFILKSDWRKTIRTLVWSLAYAAVVCDFLYTITSSLCFLSVSIPGSHSILIIKEKKKSMLVITKVFVFLHCYAVDAYCCSQTASESTQL